MRFYVTIKRWSHLMLPSNKQISQSLAGKFEITLKRGFWWRKRAEILYPQACSTEKSKICEVLNIVGFFS